jgi:Transposase DNA-binding/Transposase DDE domain
MDNTNDLINLGPLSTEMISANFGDLRLSERLGNLVDSLYEDPTASFPEALGSEAALEGAYRFLRNDKVEPTKILEPHFSATSSRAKEEELVLVLHDTTEFEFSGEVDREGLGMLSSKRAKGYYGHFSLAISAKNRTCLGVLGYRSFVRKKLSKRRKLSAWNRQRTQSKEFQRWQDLVFETQERLGSEVNVVHVMDREADCYELFANMISRSHRFVVRARYNRNLEKKKKGSKKLFDALKDAELITQRDVLLSRRKSSTMPWAALIHPGRQKRMARLSFYATTITIHRPFGPNKHLPEFLSINVVRVIEETPPDGVTPVEWTLLTTDPIETTEDVLKIVDIYRDRWIIEEYFKALKTGCAYEERQLESFKTLENALAIFIPIAWRLLLLKSLGRQELKVPAAVALTKTQVKLLKSISKKLPNAPSVHDAMIAIAKLGGHKKSNGPPGWQVLGRGYQSLLMAELGWNLAKGKKM